MPWGTTLQYLYLPMRLFHDNKSACKFAHVWKKTASSLFLHSGEQLGRGASHNKHLSIEHKPILCPWNIKNQDIVLLMTRVFRHIAGFPFKTCLLELVPIAASRIPSENSRGGNGFREGSQGFWWNEFSGPEICWNQGVWTFDLIDCMGGEANH